MKNIHGQRAFADDDLIDPSTVPQLWAENELEAARRVMWLSDLSRVRHDALRVAHRTAIDSSDDDPFSSADALGPYHPDSLVVQYACARLIQVVIDTVEATSCKRPEYEAKPAHSLKCLKDAARMLRGLPRAPGSTGAIEQAKFYFHQKIGQHAYTWSMRRGVWPGNYPGDDAVLRILTAQAYSSLRRAWPWADVDNDEEGPHHQLIGKAIRAFAGDNVGVDDKWTLMTEIARRAGVRKPGGKPQSAKGYENLVRDALKKESEILVRQKGSK